MSVSVTVVRFIVAYNKTYNALPVGFASTRLNQ